MLRNGNVMISDKRAQCGPVGTPAASLPPCGAADPEGQWGARRGRGVPRGASSSPAACPHKQGAEGTAQMLNFGALPWGCNAFQAHFWSPRASYAQNSSHLVVKNE